MHSVATRAVRPAERLELWGAFVREHIGWLETQLGLIERLGLPGYLQTQL